MLGGAKPARPADAEVQGVCDKVRQEVEQKANGGNAYAMFVATTVSTQVVAGINYFVKVQTGEGAYIHVRVYEDLSQTFTLSAFKTGMTLDDPIGYFE
ncbi:cystatin-A-like [Sycon ciliatum]|uniref:cystatin-A-like n=1 Tax=Sycon ciliatum TaxID=27933 RepID=UPI0020A86646